MVNFAVASLKSYSAAKAKANTKKLCDCPGSEPGKVKIDLDEHVRGCRFWRRSHSSAYGMKHSAVPSDIRDGSRLGLVLGEENF